LKRALARFKGEVQLVLYHFALGAASYVPMQAALCAGEQGKFWAFHDRLYALQSSWRPLSNPLPRLLEMAANLGLDTEALNSCVQSGRMRGLIEQDTAYGRSLQVSSTPTLFINDKRIVGAQGEGELVRVIREELESARRTAK
jgi:protein-disulfide isomerase